MRRSIESFLVGDEKRIVDSKYFEMSYNSARNDTFCGKLRCIGTKNYTLEFWTKQPEKPVREYQSCVILQIVKLAENYVILLKFWIQTDDPNNQVRTFVFQISSNENKLFKILLVSFFVKKIFRTFLKRQLTCQNMFLQDFTRYGLWLKKHIKIL